MRASRTVVAVSLIAGWMVDVGVVRAQTSLEIPAFSDPNLVAAIFAPPPERKTSQTRPSPFDDDWTSSRKEFRAPNVKVQIPKDWEEFDKQFAPQQHVGKPTLQLIEDSFYEVNQTLFSFKLFERKLNSLLNFEYSMRELGGYDSRTKANALDDFFDHATVKTDFDWDAPIGLYVGVKFQIKCDSIFQFWK